ncbi:hypothetical protein EDB87DRAFT_1825411 [Lactarius vividus]|nr:hypothetical protein EDB87DRAFT_1825411 [Lactarius vividus]
MPSAASGSYWGQPQLQAEERIEKTLPVPHTDLKLGTSVSTIPLPSHEGTDIEGSGVDFITTRYSDYGYQGCNIWHYHDKNGGGGDNTERESLVNVEVVKMVSRERITGKECDADVGVRQRTRTALESRLDSCSRVIRNAFARGDVNKNEMRGVMHSMGDENRDGWCARVVSMLMNKARGSSAQRRPTGNHSALRARVVAATAATRTQSTPAVGGGTASMPIPIRLPAPPLLLLLLGSAGTDVRAIAEVDADGDTRGAGNASPAVPPGDLLQAESGRPASCVILAGATFGKFCPRHVLSEEMGRRRRAGGRTPNRQRVSASILLTRGGLVKPSALAGAVRCCKVLACSYFECTRARAVAWTTSDGSRQAVVDSQTASQRGKHNINDELVFSNHWDYVFHDSRGIESGSTEELGILSRTRRLWVGPSCSNVPMRRTLSEGDDDISSSGTKPPNNSQYRPQMR